MKVCSLLFSILANEALFLHLLTGYWYVDVVNDSSLLTTMAHSTSARIAFMFGLPLPPDDEVQMINT